MKNLGTPYNPANTVSGGFDVAFGSTQGMLLYRGASGWAALAAGTSGQLLQSGGASANPAWVAAATGSGAPSAYNTQALPYTAAASDKGTAINPTGTGALSLPAATAVSGWYAWIKKRDEGGTATLTPASGTIDGLASIRAYKEEFLVYYDAAGSATAGAPVYRTQGRQRGWIDYGAFTVTSGNASFLINAFASDSELRDIAVSGFGFTYSATSFLSLSVATPSNSPASLVGESLSYAGTTGTGAAVSGTSLALTTTSTTAQRFRLLIENIQSSGGNGIAITGSASYSGSNKSFDTVVSSTGALSSLTLSTTSTLSAGAYNVRFYRP